MIAEPSSSPECRSSLVGLVTLCSQNSATGVDRARLASILSEPQVRAEPEAPPVRRWKRLTPSERALVAKRYEAGETSIALAGEYGVAKSTILRTLREANVVVRRQPLTPTEVSQAAALYESGRSLSEVAAQMSLKQDTIRLALKARGVTLRPATGR